MLLTAGLAIALAGGCGPTPAPVDDSAQDSLRRLADDALARYDQAVALATGQTRFVPAESLNSQIGTWEAHNVEHERALRSGRIHAAADLPAAPEPTGAVVWSDGHTLVLPLLAAEPALQALAADGASDCPGCPPLEAVKARLITRRVDTSRGVATAPAWEYTLRGTGVRVVRVAVEPAGILDLVPPAGGPTDVPAIAVEAAVTKAGSTELTVRFNGVPHPGGQPCGADYRGEAVESANAVVVLVHESRTPAKDCPSDAATRETTVALAAPLGARAVLEPLLGRSVPVRFTS